MILRRFSLYTTSRRVGEADYVAKVRKVFMKNKFFSICFRKVRNVKQQSSSA